MMPPRLGVPRGPGRVNEKTRPESAGDPAGAGNRFDRQTGPGLLIPPLGVAPEFRLADLLAAVHLLAPCPVVGPVARRWLEPRRPARDRRGGPVLARVVRVVPVLVGRRAVAD